MATVEHLRNSLINKILVIKDKEVLSAIDKLLSINKADEFVELTDEQKIMLNMSESDIKNGDVISQKELFYKEKEWLNGQ